MYFKKLEKLQDAAVQFNQFCPSGLQRRFHRCCGFGIRDQLDFGKSDGCGESFLSSSGGHAMGLGFFFRRVKAILEMIAAV